MVMRRVAPVVAFVAFAVTSGMGLSLAASEPQPSIKADLARLTFADPLIERRFMWFNKFAESVARSGWHRRPYQTFSNREKPTNYFAEWATFANDDGRNPSNYHGPKECHSLGSSATFDSQNRTRITGVSYGCRSKPAGKGWSAYIGYYTWNEQPAFNSRAHEGFSLHFQHYPRLDKPDLLRHDFSIDRGANAGYQTRFTADNIVYEIKVATWDHAQTLRLRQKQPDAEIRRIIATPESFRDHFLSAFERLARKIETDFADGSAIETGREARNTAENEDPRRLLSDRPMTAKEKETCLAKARADVNARKRMIREHYREMYAAANKALPLLEMIRDQ